MKEDVKELEQAVASLEEELKASLAREEALEEHMRAPKKELWLRAKVNDPGSKVGKVIRLPRTIYRIVRYPDVRRSMRGEEPVASEKKEDVEVKDEGVKFAPVKFFHGNDSLMRVNLVVREVREEMLKRAIEFANQNKCELRVVTYGEKNAVLRYRKMKAKKGFPAAEKISFYSSVDQAKRNNPFELEIGKNDMFLADEWGTDGKR